NRRRAKTLREMRSKLRVGQRRVGRADDVAGTRIDHAWNSQRNSGDVVGRQISGANRVLNDALDLLQQFLLGAALGFLFAAREYFAGLGRHTAKYFGAANIHGYVMLHRSTE